MRRETLYPEACMPRPKNPLSPLPADLGYAIPPEWARHCATWLAWPHSREDWPGKFDPIPQVFTELVRVLTAGERVCLFTQPTRGRPEALDFLSRAGVDLKQVDVIPQTTDRAWVRDSGPIFLTRRGAGSAKTARLAALDFKFNAWARYDNFFYDDLLPRVVAHRLGVPAFQPYARTAAGDYQHMVLEGGSIDTNGAGCVLTTEECLLSRAQCRNPGVPREALEEALCDYLGVKKVLWLGRGIAGDDTHGHVDDLARFVSPTTIVTAVETNRQDVNYPALTDNLRRLKKMRDARNKPFTVVELPMPAPLVFDGQRLPASYANFYIANAGVLVPVFNDPADAVALKTLERCFRDRPIVPIYCRDLVWGLGTLHCLTQQQPE